MKKVGIVKTYLLNLYYSLWPAKALKGELQKMQYENGSPDEWIIAESDHYCIKGCYEEAIVYRRVDDSYITCVGDFYGDPHDGIIDKNERFCVTVGCGYIIYYLIDPFQPYSYDKKTPQWVEKGRGPDNILWVESVRQISDTVIEIELEDGKKEVIQIPVNDLEQS